MKITKEQEFYNALYHLRRNYSHGVHTYGNCCIENCTNNARGSGKCVKHLESEIAEILDSKILANKIHAGTRKMWMDINSALAIIEEADEKIDCKNCNDGF